MSDPMVDAQGQHTGLPYLVTSLLSGTLGFITLHTVYEYLQAGATIISMAAGLMAIRHYYLQNKKK